MSDRSRMTRTPDARSSLWRRPSPVIVALCLAFVLGAGRPASGHADIEQQIDALTRRIEQEPGQATLFLRRAELHRIHRNWSAARSDYREARRLDPGLDAVDLCLGRMDLDRDRPRRAKAALDRYLLRRPADAEGLTLRGQALALLGETQAAVDDYRRALAVPGPRPPDPDTYLDLARLVAGKGDDHRDAALRVLDSGIATLGPVVSLQMAAMRIEISLRRYDQALQRLDTITSQAGRKERWILKRAEILHQAGRTQEAVLAYHEVLALVTALPADRRAAPAVRGMAAQACAALAGIPGSQPGSGERCP
jgi:predicted Zn-dependent protease